MTIVRKTGALGVAGSATVAVGIVPAAVASAGETGRRAWLDFFAAQIRNRNTRQAYARAAHRLFDWLAEYGIHDVVDIEPVHIAVWLEERMREAVAPDRQAGTGRDPAAVRLADGPPGGFVVAGRRRARSEAYCSPRDDAGSFRR